MLPLANTQPIILSVLAVAVVAWVAQTLPLPSKLRSALRYASLAALVAIIVPDVLPWTTQSGPQFDLRFLAIGMSVLVFLATRNALLVILSGMLALWSLRGLLLLF